MCVEKERIGCDGGRVVNPTQEAEKKILDLLICLVLEFLRRITHFTNSICRLGTIITYGLPG